MKILSMNLEKLCSIWLAAFILVIIPNGYALAQEPEKRGATAEDLAAIRDIKAMSISPDGQNISYQLSQPDIVSNSYTFTWYVVPAAGGHQGKSGMPRFIADGGDLIFDQSGLGSGIHGEFSASPPVWSPDSKRFAYALKKDGEVQIWMSYADRPGQKQLTRSEGVIRHFVWSDDGKSILYSVGRFRKDKEEIDRKGRTNGYLVKADVFATSIDMPTPPPCRVDESLEELADAFGITEDALTCFVTIWKYDFKTRQDLPAGPDDIKAFEVLTARDKKERERYARSGDARFMQTRSKNGQQVAWAENINPDVYRGSLPPRRIAGTTEKGAAICDQAECQSTRFSGLWWRDDAAELYFLVRIGPKQSLTAFRKWTPDIGEVKTILETDDQFSDCHFLQAHLICIAEAWTSPNKIVSIDLETGALTVLVDPNPEFGNFQFTKIEKLVWKDAFGNTALAHLVYPKNYQEERTYPMVVTTYRSRGFLRGAVGDEQPIHVLAQNGFFVLSYDLPEDEESALKESDFIEWSKAVFDHQLLKRGALTALETILDRLSERGLIDPDRVGITAFSFGSNLLQVALVHSNRFAATSTAWLPDNQSGRHFRPRDALKMAEAIFGDDYFDEASELWRKISVSVNAEKIDVPLLFQVADREYFGTLPTFVALKDAKKPVEMYRFHNEHHVKWQPAHRYTVYRRNIDWFNFWLRDHEDSDPEKAEQYVRWRKLREQHEANLSEQAGNDNASLVDRAVGEQ